MQFRGDLLKIPPTFCVFAWSVIVGLVIRQSDGDAFSVGRKTIRVEVNPEKGVRLTVGKTVSRWLTEGDVLEMNVGSGMRATIATFRHNHQSVSLNITADRSIKIVRF